MNRLYRIAYHESDARWFAYRLSFNIRMPAGTNSALLGVILLLMLGSNVPSASAQTNSSETAASAPAASEQDEETARQSLRERLTEREDENRLQQPLSVQFSGRPLFFSGELELRMEHLQGTGIVGTGVADTAGARQRRSLFESEFEAEAFYPFSDNYSAFAQVRAGVVDAIRGSTEDGTGGFFERGEMWLYAENFVGLGWDIDVGRLAFEDERRWWWDEELDALRLQRERGNFALSIALARELAARTTESNFIDAEQAKVRRLILESSWDWAEEHALQLFALDQHDSSRTPLPGELVGVAHIDTSDADLRWLGARATGAFDLGSAGQFAYWFDSAHVRGVEHTVEFEDSEALAADASRTVGEIDRSRIRGRALDLGLTWALPGPVGPRLSLGYAQGSGDSDAEDSRDQAFRQTGLEANESGFGGVQRFAQYGIVLDPELSNLAISSAGFGVSLLQSSSIDLRYSSYRLRERNGELRDTRIELALPPAIGSTGIGSARIGSAIDLVLAIEEGERFELELQLGGFRPGAASRSTEPSSDTNAFSRDWIWAGVLAFRAAF